MLEVKMKNLSFGLLLLFSSNVFADSWYQTEPEAYAACIATQASLAATPNTTITVPCSKDGSYWSVRYNNLYDYIWWAGFYDACQYGLDAVTGLCRTPPQDYTCSLPKEWILTTEVEWKCVLIGSIPPTNIPNTTGTYGTSGNYHTGSYNSTECDSDIPYECIIPNCEFWNPLSLVNALCK